MSSILSALGNTIRRNPARAMLVVGTMLGIVSIAWEYSRMRPDYRFLVEPWSLRGYQLTQGRVVAVLSAGLLVLAIVAWSRFDKRISGFGFMVAAAVVVAATLIAAVVSPEPREYSANGIGALAMAGGIGLVVALAYRDVVARRIGGAAGYLTWPIWIITSVVLWVVVIKPNFIDDSQTIELWVIVLALLTVFFLPAVLAPPRSLAVNRILILSVATAWGVAVISAGAVRSTLLRKQLEDAGVAAQYKDTQITSGMMLAFFGLLLALLGAIALWAKRRDELEAQRRARQQREAAERSMEELTASGA